MSCSVEFLYTAWVYLTVATVAVPF